MLSFDLVNDVLEFLRKSMKYWHEMMVYPCQLDTASPTIWMVPHDWSVLYDWTIASMMICWVLLYGPLAEVGSCSTVELLW